MSTVLSSRAVALATYMPGATSDDQPARPYWPTSTTSITRPAGVASLMASRPLSTTKRTCAAVSWSNNASPSLNETMRQWSASADTCSSLSGSNSSQCASVLSGDRSAVGGLMSSPSHRLDGQLMSYPQRAGRRRCPRIHAVSADTGLYRAPLLDFAGVVPRPRTLVHDRKRMP